MTRSDHGAAGRPGEAVAAHRRTGPGLALLGGVVLAAAVVAAVLLLWPAPSDQRPSPPGAAPGAGNARLGAPADGAPPAGPPAPAAARTPDPGSAAPRTESPGPPAAVVPADAPGVAPPAARAGTTAPGARVRERLLAPWGAGPDALGRSIPEEGAPVGPASFAVGEDGTLFVLDAVNERVQVFPPGGPPRAVRLPDDTAQDLALLPDGGFAVLDRTRERTLTLLDPAGGLVAELPLEGDGVPAAGGVTGVFAREDGLWVEVEHGALVRVAGPDGAPTEPRERVAGRFQPGGDPRGGERPGGDRLGTDRVITAHIQRPDRVIVLARPAAAADAPPALLAEVAFPLPVHHIVGLDFDAAGRIHLGVWLARFAAAPPFAVEEERFTVVVLAPGGAELNRVALPATGRPEEQTRSLVVAPDGIVYHLVPTDDGVVVQEILP